MALVSDQAIFDNVNLVRTRACFMDDSQECIRLCGQYQLLAMQMGCPTCNYLALHQELAPDTIALEKLHLQLWQILPIIRKCS